MAEKNELDRFKVLAIGSIFGVLVGNIAIRIAAQFGWPETMKNPVLAVGILGVGVIVGALVFNSFFSTNKSKGEGGMA